MKIRTAEDDVWRAHAVLHGKINADVRLQRQDVAGVGHLFLQRGHGGLERGDLGLEGSYFLAEADTVILCVDAQSGRKRRKGQRSGYSVRVNALHVGGSFEKKEAW